MDEKLCFDVWVLFIFNEFCRMICNDYTRALTAPLQHVQFMFQAGSGGRFINEYELLNLRALKISMLYKNHIY